MSVAIRTGPHLARRTVRAVMSAAALAVLSACSGDSDPSPGAEPSIAATSPAPTTSSSGTPSAEPAKTRLRITAGDTVLSATLRGSAAARDLVAQLPLTIDMSDHGGVEKTGAIPQPLSLDGQPEGADPDPSELGYYAPGQDLVLYHGDQGYFPGIVILGTLDGDVAALGREGDLTVRVEMATD